MIRTKAGARNTMLALAIWLAPSLPLLAQARMLTLPPLDTVTVTGSTHCSAAQLAAASGLQKGQAINPDAMRQGATRLAATGDFANVSTRYTYSPKGTDVQYQVVDATQLVPVVFDNFIWLPGKQLVSLLQSEIPCFCGDVPLTGGVDRQITAALQAYLRQHGIKGATVDGMPYQADLGSNSFDSYLFTVEGVKIPLQQVAFPGAPAGVAPVLRQDSAALIGQNFSLARVASAGTAALPELQDRGFLQAELAAPVVQRTNPATNAVSVSIAVNSGRQYRWGAVGVQGNAAIAAGKLQQLMKMRAGSVADRAVLDQGIAAIQKLYGDAGYIEATVAPTFDYSQPGVAAVTVAIHEGPQFRMGAVSFQGVAGNAAAQLARLWELHPGQPFRAAYLRQYLKSLHAHFNFHGVNIQTTEAPDLQHHLVNVTIALSKSSPAGGGGGQARPAAPEETAVISKSSLRRRFF